MRRAPQDPREARETLAPSALLGSTAWQEPPDPQAHQGPLAPPGPQAQDSPQGLMTWKAPGAPSGQQPEVLTGCRDRLARPESRGILELWGHQGAREKLEQTEHLASPASQAERVQLDPRDQKEKRGLRERKETQGRMEWGSQDSRDLLDPQDLSSTCRSRTECWRACQAPRAVRASLASPDQPGQRETWAPKASRASRDPRVRRESRARSSALTAEH